MSAREKSSKKVQVRFFGSFEVSVGGRCITEASSRSRRPWSLLQYMMVHRNKALSRQQLMEALWPDGSSDQPEKALKNLVYRIRSFFTQMEVPFAQSMILYQNGSYHLNNDIPWELDIERFEHCCAQAKKEPSTEGKIAYYQEAMNLYQGDFLAEHVYDDWVLPYNTYYRGMYFKCAELLLPLLEQEGRHEDMEQISRRALEIDRFEEGLHLAYMKALLAQKKTNAALAHYNYLSDMLFRELGVTPGEELRALYRQMSNSPDFVLTDLQSIKERLSEAVFTQDAFYCDFETFRSLYQLEIRSAERAGNAVFIGLLTILGEGTRLPAHDLLDKAMLLLLEAINSSLRRGDVVARFSIGQYVLMLPTVTVENGEIVMQRIVDNFARLCPMEEIRLDAKIQPMDPTPPPPPPGGGQQAGYMVRH